jgi:hypothetical protein
MTTQGIVAFAGNKNMSRAFSDTATDGQFSGNLLLSSNASQNIGLEMPAIKISFLSMTYTAGVGLWRIQDSNTLRTERYGFCSKVGYVCHTETKIPTYQIKPTDLLQVYPRAVNGTSNDSEVLGWVMTQKGPEPFGCTTASDGTLTEVKSLISDLGLGDYAFGQKLISAQFQVEDGASLVSMAILDATGGTVFQQTGNVRAPSAGSTSTQVNISAMLDIPVQKGWTMKIAVTSA